MNRREFMDELRVLLKNLPYGEQEDALQFYEEYFDDAGTENEQRVIKELESPEAVAKKIIQNSPSVPAQREWHTASGDKTSPGGRNTSSSEMPGDSQYDSSVFEQYYRNQQMMNQQKSNNWVLWLVLIVTCPLWISLGIGLLLTLFSLVITVLALIFSAVVTVIALVAAVVLALIIGVPMLFYDPLNGLYMISMAMIAAGAALILTPPVIWLCKRGVPGIFRGIGKLFSSSTQKAKSTLGKESKKG